MHSHPGFSSLSVNISRSGIAFQKGIFYFTAVVIFVALFVFLPQGNCFAQAPDIEWQKTFGGSSSDEGESIVQTSDGGYIIAGWTYSNDFDVSGNHSPGNGDCWIIKTDPTGNIQWKKTIGGTKYEDALIIKETQDGGYIIGGHSSSEDGDLNSNYNNSLDALVIKLDKFGNIEWLKSLGGDGYDAIISVDESQDGGYIFAGYTGSNNIDVLGNHGDFDAWIVKLNNSGNIQWQKCIGGTEQDVAWSITSSSDGGYVFTGYTRSADGDITFNHGQLDILVGKLDASGTIQWLKTMGGSAEEWAKDIIPASDGGYVVAGYTFSTNGNVSTNFGLNDFWILKLDAMGNLQWEKSYGGSDYEDPYSIDQTNDGGYVIAGRTRSNNGNITVNNGGNDYWILKLDVNGNMQWQKSVGGSQQDVAHSIKETSDTGFIIAGTSYSSDGDVATNRGQGDIWIVKLGVCMLNTPDIPGTITGNTTPCTGTAVSYSIQTVSQATGYTWIFPAGWTIISGQGTTQITVLAGNNSGEVSVLAYNNCKSSGNNTVVITPINVQTPQITVRSDVGNNICQGAQVVFTADILGAISPMYQWKKNGINIGLNSNVYSENNLQSGDIISCELISVTNCGNQSVVSPGIVMSVSPLITPAIIISSSATSICKGADVEFTATSTNQGPNPSYIWYVNNVNAGTNLPTFKSNSLSDGDVISCELISSEGCVLSTSALSNNITIHVNADTEASINITSSTTTICKNDEVKFTAVANNAGTSPTYTWLLNGTPVGSNTAVFVTRNLSDKDEVVCSVRPGSNTCAISAAFSNKITITINPLPRITIFPTDTLVKPGTQVTFSISLSENIRSFGWSPGGMLVEPSLLQPTTVPILAPITYRLIVITKDGCSLYKDVNVKPLIPLYIPTAFTPNGDGKNDLYRIPPGTDFDLTEFSLYNIWGKRVFTTKNINAGWDGRVNGIDQSSGVFVYTIAGFQESKPISLKGTFILIR